MSSNKYWTEEKIKEACEFIFTEIAEKGKSLNQIVRENTDRKKIPSKVAFNEWLSKDSKLAYQYARACTDRNEKKFESIEQDYLEEPRLDPTTGKIDTGWVQLQRLKIDAKKWELSKLEPKKYGDKLDVTSDNEKINNTDTTNALLGELLKKFQNK